MPRDVFNREVDLGQPIASDAVRILIPGMTEEGLLAQQVSIHYEQAITQLYEVGSAKTYFVAGRPSGQLQIKRVVGAQGLSVAFLAQYGDVCNVNKNSRIVLDLSAGCSTTASVGSISATGCVIQGLTYTVATPEMIINEEVNMMIARLESIS